MSYRADVDPGDLTEAKLLAQEMSEAMGWEGPGDDLARHAYMSGVVDCYLRELGYDVFG